MNAARLKKLYGISVADWQVLTASGRCPLCQLPYSDKPARRPTLDHSHATLRARGVTCSACNYFIGLRSDDPGWYERAAQYLRHPPADELLDGPRRPASAPPQ